MAGLTSDCPELTKLMDMYDQIADASATLSVADLEHIERSIAACPGRDGPSKPDGLRVCVQIVGREADLRGGNALGHSLFANQRDVEAAQNRTRYFSEPHRVAEETVDPDTYYVYVKRRECPYFEKSRGWLTQTKSRFEERDFTDDNAAQVALPVHRVGLLEALRQTNGQSPQIFYGVRLLPGGSAGLRAQLGLDRKPTVHVPAQAPAPIPKVSRVPWFIYGWSACGACKDARRVVGDRGKYTEMFHQVDGEWERIPNTQLDPDHLTFLTASQQAEILDHVLTTDAVPIIYFKAQLVPNSDLAEKVATFT